MQKDIAIEIDLSYLQMVAGGDKQFEKTVLATAVMDIQQQVEGLQKAWEQQNATAVRDAAHSLKSVTAIAGLPQLESACKIIDRLFADGIFHTSETATFYEIINGWEAVKPQLAELVDNY